MAPNQSEITLLIIDDDVALTKLIGAVLRDRHFELHCAQTAREGLALAKQVEPDIFLVDMILPDLDGLQICQRIRQFSKMPILMLSAVDKPGMVEQALNAGADDYLLKPVPNSTLIAHLNTLARRTRQIPSRSILANSFTRP